MKHATSMDGPAVCKCRLPKRLLMAVMLVLVSACGITSQGLIPKDLPTSARQIGKTVKIMPVAGGQGREAFITNEQYQEALSRTIADSRIFARVVETGPADLELFSEIITVTSEGGISPSFAVVVQYWVVDPATGREVWRKGINTRHQVQWNEAFAGGTRGIMAIEGATQKNLIRLVKHLEAADLR